MDDPFERPDLVNQSQARHAAEWGLASLLMGGILSILSLLALLINIILYAHALSGPFLGPGELTAVFIAAIFGAVIVPAICVTGIVFGIRSLASAFGRDQPGALGWAGLLMSLLALLLWIAVIVDLFMILGMMQRF